MRIPSKGEGQHVFSEKSTYIRLPTAVQLLSRVQLFATSGTAARQVPPSMGFSRKEYWSGVPSPSPGDCGDQTHITCIMGGFFTAEPPRKPLFSYKSWIFPQYSHHITLNIAPKNKCFGVGHNGLLSFFLQRYNCDVTHGSLYSSWHTAFQNVCSNVSDKTLERLVQKFL